MSRRWVVLAAALLLPACFAADAQLCSAGDGSAILCPRGTTCGSDANGEPYCMSLGGSDSPAPFCGDGIVTPPEQCDTRDHTIPCSADCLSNLTCGNGVVDAVNHEQCDDGDVRSHDGCDSHCLVELPHWLQLAGAEPSGRVDAAMAYDARHDQVVLFGGATDDGTDLGDTWTRTHGIWQQHEPLLSPSARSGAAMAYDGADGHVYLFGGNENADTWRWTGTTWELVGGSVSPPPLESPQMIYDGRRARLVLIGAAFPASLGGQSFQTWELVGGTWTPNNGFGSAGPSPRTGMAFGYDAIHEYAVMYGGTSTEVGGSLGDTWTYGAGSGSAGQWQEIQTSAGPPRLTGGRLGFDGAELVLAPEQPSSIVVALNSANPTAYVWDGSAWEAGSGETPPLQSAPLAFSPTERLIMFGGKQFNGGGAQPGLRGQSLVSLGESFPHDTLAWDGAQFTIQTPPLLSLPGAVGGLDVTRARPVMVAAGAAYQLDTGTWSRISRDAGSAADAGGPTASVGLAAAYDEAQMQLVCFGGADGSGSLTTGTYLLHDGAWTAGAGSADEPSPRRDHAMAFSARERLVVLFGGRASETDPSGSSDGVMTELADTWAWNGKAWKQLTPTKSPSSRFGHAMAFDRAHDQIVMFGGQHGADRLAETWVFAQGEWQQIAAPAPGVASPSARIGAAMSWDPARRRIVMFGGVSSVLEQDTWEWDGSSWLQLPITSQPPARTQGVLVGTADGIALFAGATTFASTGSAAPDIWLLRYDGAGFTDSCVDQSDDDSDNHAGCEDSDCWLACGPGDQPGDRYPRRREEPYCGDGRCTGLETAALCPLDCAPVAICGDAVCTMEESTCPGDCPQ